MSSAFPFAVVSRMVIAAFPLLMASVCAVGGEPEKADQKSVRALVEQLASQNFQEREAATRELERRDEAAPLVRAAAGGADAEITKRAARILRALDQRVIERAASAALRGRIDWFNEVISDPDRQDEFGFAWKTAVELNKEIMRRLPVLHTKKCGILGDFQLRTTATGEVTVPGLHGLTTRNCLISKFTGALVLRTDELTIKTDGIGTCALFVTGDVRGYKSLVGTSIVVSNGSAVFDDWSGQSIIICDGDLECARMGASVAICRGEIKCKVEPFDCFLCSGGRVDCPRTEWVAKKCTIKEKDRFPLNFVRFFETTDAGIGVALAEDGVKIVKLAEGQPPAKAGLKVGDVITALDGKPASNPEVFRRLLRRGTVADETKFTVKRNGKEITITASFLGWEPPKE